MKTTFIIAVLLVLAGVGFVLYDMQRGTMIDNGTPIATSTPTAMYTNATADSIVVTTPAPGASLGSTFTVSGQARGTWYFEANFPIKVVDQNGALLVQLPVQAIGEWMTEAFVPFTVDVTVPNYSGPATLVLEKDNPSGEAAFDASVAIPIEIASTTELQ